LAAPDVEVFAADLEPVCADPAAATMMRPLLRSSRRRAARVSEHRVLPFLLKALTRAPFGVFRGL
jgi:hypothetical protein